MDDSDGLLSRFLSDAIIGPEENMAAEPLEIRMARLEGAYEQINHRLSELHVDVQAIRAQISSQFYWLLTLILGSILIPIVRDVL
jgi:hypothetical protein